MNAHQLRGRIPIRPFPFVSLIVLALVSSGSEMILGQDVPETISYQGVLTDAITGDPVADANYEITFTLYEAGTSTTVWSEIQPTVSTVDGIFNVDLGTVNTLSDVLFDIEYDLGIEVGKTELLPRTPLSSAPYALAMRSFRVENKTVSSDGLWYAADNIIAGRSENYVVDGKAGATISGGGATFVPAGPVHANSVDGDFGTVGGGYGNTAGIKATIGGGNLNEANGTGSAVGGGLNNTTWGPWSAIGGGRENIAHERSSTVAGGEENQAYQFYATVGGGGGQEGDGNGGGPNLAYDKGSTVSGGSKNIAGDSGLTDDAIGMYTTIGGGYGNSATITYATIGGGENNQALASHATIGGGGGGSANNEGNKVYDDWGTVGGGQNNTAGSETGESASQLYATVGGGVGNVASGTGATVPGGVANNAPGLTSFAAGLRATAMDDGSFVWNDRSGGATPLLSKGTNTFNAKAENGFYFHTDAGATLGAKLDPGATAWSVISDRNLKTGIREVSGPDILSRLERMPVSTWSYKADESQTVHMGPMAQDFYEAFGLGSDELSISTLDADGVALAAIKGLYELVLEQQKQIEELILMVEGQ